jgi:hypothetical protein
MECDLFNQLPNDRDCRCNDSPCVSADGFFGICRRSNFWRHPSHFVYGIVRADDRLLLYVGQTNAKWGARCRLDNHRRVQTSRKPPKKESTWFKWLKANRKVKLDVVVLAELEDATQMDAIRHETEMIRALSLGGVQLLNDHERPGHLLVDYLARANLPVVIRRRDPANDNQPNTVTIDPDAIPEEVMDR